MALFLSEENIMCPVCHDIYEDPVVLSCTHSVCKDCLKKYWSTNKSQECPLCRRKSSRDNPPVSIVLKDLCEAYTKEKKLPGEFCPSHEEQFKLFCKEDKQLLCVVCLSSKKHKTHDCSPVDEAAADLKVETRDALKSLQDKLTKLKSSENICCCRVQNIKSQAEKTESLIKEEFQKLHQFLRDEEKAHLDVLKEEEEEKSRLLKERIDDISKEMSSLADRIKDLEEKLKFEAIVFLSDFKDTIERIQCSVKELEPAPGGLIDVAQHLGNLNFRVWLKMRDISHYSPVILDPNTAGDKLSVSNDLTTVNNSYARQSFPDERLDSSVILGSEGFDSGTYSWDVHVGKHKYWDIGMTTAPSQTEKHFWSTTWCLSSRCNYMESNIEHCISFPGKDSPLSLSKPPETIRVHLNFDEGQIIFDPVGNTGTYTINHSNFTEKVFPFIHTYYQSGLHPIKIIPVCPTVEVVDIKKCKIQF
ncbi:E3 ubiquitin-protein ligase TRIM35-like [Sardina pilchardus]|uniref:E3 ubiquitin-protein ligase TRIM35-like n=1 Tax=Sardina pilchardus TaxID=27697 RepID=UPI002E160FF2